jgi:hypothetical protein
VVPEVDSRLEALSAHVALEVADVVVLRPDVGVEPAGLAEAFVAVLAPDLGSI